MTSGDGPVRVGELVDSVLRRRGLRKGVRRMEVLDQWSRRVGEGIARVTRPRSVSEGTLFVEVRSSAWLMELNLQKSQILERINDGRDDEARIDRIVFLLAEEG